MTKEAKVGMLTGLAVIVLIGVLLSEYLGGPAVAGGAAGAGGNVATGRMAALPIGETKREEILQPVGVPSMARADDAGGTGVMTQVPTAYATMNPQQNAVASAAPAVPTLPEGPVVKAPVSVVPAGPVQMVSAQGNELPPTVQLGDPKPVTGTVTGAGTADATKAVAAATASTPAKVTGQEYVIAKGDSLDKIAKKFYKANTSVNRARITAANPSLLKNGQPFLIAGRKIMIPDAPAAVAAAPTGSATGTPKAAAASAAQGADEGVIIRQPGAAAAPHAAAVASSSQADGATAVKAKPAVKTYVVKPGDSLEKIAKRIDSANYRDAEKKLMAVNGIKDAGSLQAGQTLKLPV